MIKIYMIESMRCYIEPVCPHREGATTN